MLRLAVAAHLARYKGDTRVHTASDLNSYLRWCLEHSLSPLEARTRSRRALPALAAGSPSAQALDRLPTPFGRSPGFYRTCVIDGVLEHSPAEYVRRPTCRRSHPPSG